MSTSQQTSPDLLKQTMRTVLVLVVACVVFVGTLSVAAVAAVSRAFAASPTTNAELAKPDPTAKKPLSI